MIILWRRGIYARIYNSYCIGLANSDLVAFVEAEAISCEPYGDRECAVPWENRTLKILWEDRVAKVAWENRSFRVLI